MRILRCLSKLYGVSELHIQVELEFHNRHSFSAIQVMETGTEKYRLIVLTSGHCSVEIMAGGEDAPFLTKHFVMKMCGGVDAYIHVSLTSEPVGGEWSASRRYCVTPEERAPGTLWIGSWWALAS
jgi:hypothetical protein